MISRTTRWMTSPFRLLIASRARGRNVRETRSRPVDLEALETRELLNGDSGAWSFASAPQLHPMKVNVLTRRPGTSRGLIFVAPYAFNPQTLVGQTGPLILDDAGNPIWFKPQPAPNVTFDFATQTLFGKPVLTWWEGSAATGGPHGLPIGTALPGSRFVIDNNHYQQMMTVTARNGFTTDLHDFVITPRGIGVIIGTKVQNADLTPYGGPKNGSFLDTEIQEIDLRTGRLVFSWDLGQHVPLSDSYLPTSPSPDIVWDPYHVNSVDVSPDGKQLLVSARHTSTVYDVSQKTGQILWQLGGKHNQLHVAPNLITGPDSTVFQYQHDARFVPGGISLFDNGSLIPGPASGPFGPGRGLVFQIDSNSLTATLQGSPYYHDPALYPNSQGNLQSLPNGDKFIGWGAEPVAGAGLKSYYSEYSSNGALLYDVVLPGQNVSYRAFRSPWVGRPLTAPAVAVTEVGGQRTIEASWNGSTQTTAWKLLAGRTPNHLTRVSITPRTGFETAIAAGAAGPFYKVQALGAGGAVLKSSAVIRG